MHFSVNFKRIFLVVALLIAVALSTLFIDSILYKKETLPEKIKSQIIDDENNGLPIIIKGVVLNAYNKWTETNEVVMKVDTGKIFILFNAPYVNTLKINNLFGKTVKLSGLNISKTQYANYPGLYIQDILEVQ